MSRFSKLMGIDQAKENYRRQREKQGHVSEPKPPPYSKELAKATRDWTLPVVMRQYESNEKGQAAFADEAAVLDGHGYRPAMQSEEGGHVHAGRLILTGGFSIFAGRKGIRSKGKLTVTFARTS